jgi:hypothetical protein|tara:strand:- start:293 stop:628 length:336 start_codon:yes stop_codon:yes gene_type:complete
MKNLIIVFLTLVVVSCATQSVVSNSYKEQSAIIIEGKLLGLSVKVDNFVIDEIKRSDLRKDKSQMGTQIYDRVLRVNLKPGKHNLILTKEGSIVYKEEIYILKGQVKRITI